MRSNSNTVTSRAISTFALRFRVRKARLESYKFRGQLTRIQHEVWLSVQAGLVERDDPAITLYYVEDVDTLPIPDYFELVNLTTNEVVRRGWTPKFGEGASDDTEINLTGETVTLGADMDATRIYGDYGGIAPEHEGRFNLPNDEFNIVCDGNRPAEGELFLKQGKGWFLSSSSNMVINRLLALIQDIPGRKVDNLRAQLATADEGSFRVSIKVKGATTHSS